ncbi:hypothetical protein BLS_009473 [Venturia inaequalis]|uniref:Small ribosomal subunit protein mS33 n=1 Tax=Venturia inaequalis TaxID=5025 RepID=A0A8H3UZI2_VENIN|nr:hypothetical protein EG328_001540 [Venturia inaequalis]KAE9979791.1 hypothetical protein BLS_009473 [Venturia inaequalis]KAE9991529.1 hypothetical protein EG327_011550 [Venturia inaequalis]RDI86546.1 hypothetical protein Vi05172_g3376 [Venturia inaequalis]
MAVARSRILDLIRTQCSVFNTTFNPERLRLGNKILRQRLKGPQMALYYPPRTNNIAELRKAYPELEFEDEKEEERLESIKLKKARGKGAPKKRRSAAESKRLQKRKPKGPTPT